ncbi:methyl-accepting chemotaxis protein [Pseudorhodoplanes sp.]|uniref:methyl-accepting chemotaxis protein n=1 Tax=Pseudorhodoplanes sp. TaxID=1934341 RepID=UPI00391DB8B3
MSKTTALAERLQFVGLDPKGIGAIKAVKPQIDKEMPSILDGFYNKIASVPEVSRFFADSARIGHAKSAQLKHWSRISSGDFSEEFVQSVNRIGGTHARIGLEPRWYIGGYALITAELAKSAIAAMWPKGFLQKQGHEQAAETVAALIKAAMLDMDLAISTYIEAAESARKAAEEEKAAAARKQAAVVEALSRSLALLAQGDLTARLSADIPEEYGKLREDFNAAVTALGEAVGAVAEAAQEVTGASREISAATTAFSQRTEEQAASLEQTSASMEQIAATVKNNADNARQANALAQATRETADRGGAVVGEAVSAMARIEESSRRISDIISVIDEIARQTNLLALNAAVEAARAGEAGRGFAVVAAEVRSLAQRSSQAAKDIKDLIVNSSGQVKDGVELVNRAGSTLNEIVESIKRVADIVSEISTASGEQAGGIDQVNRALNQMDEATQQNSAMVEENAAAARTLDQQAAVMIERLGRFKVTRQSRAAGAAAPVRKAPVPVRPVAVQRNAAPAVTVRGNARQMQTALARAITSDDWEEF